VSRESGMSDADWEEAIANCRCDDPELKAWMMNQVRRGQRYYIERLRQVVKASGGRALDAGCGMGNWSAGLAHFFDVVDAIDIDDVRVSALDAIAPYFGSAIRTARGSIEALPYPDAAFDFVFCNGVIFLTDVDKTLAEFARVLRPGGGLYLTFNSTAWWRHLLLERARQEPVCRTYGANGLLAAVIHGLRGVGPETLRPAPRRVLYLALCDAVGLRPSAWKWLRDPAGASAVLCSAIDTAEPWTERSRRLRAALGGARMEADRRIMTRTIGALDIIDCLCEHAPETHQRHALAEACFRLLCGRPWRRASVHTYSYESEDMLEALAAWDFTRLSVAPEGCLRLHASENQPAPIYAKRLGVIEAYGELRAAPGTMTLAAHAIHSA
jgi:SAM-dependent methyltransferase